MNEHQWPPAFFLLFFRWFCNPRLRDHIEGDLVESYNRHLLRQGKRRASIRFMIEVLLLFRPGIIRKANGYGTINSYGMYKSYFTIALRNLTKQKLYSVINIGGLTLGLTCFLVILMYVLHEFSFNRFYKNADRIYRVYQKQTGNEFMGTDYFALTPSQLASIMREEFPGVERATTVGLSSGLIDYEGKHFWERGMSGDEQFLNVFALPFLKGNPATAMQDAKCMILTKSLADKIFKNADPMGKTVKYQNKGDFVVTGVVEDPSLHSSFQYSFILNINFDEQYVSEVKRAGWTNNSHYTFFLLAAGASAHDIEAKFPAVIKKNQRPEDYADYPFKDQYFVSPLLDLYFQPAINFDSEVSLKGNRTLVLLFSGVAVMVLLLACVNYTNLAVARSIKRSREVGLRKVVGAFRRQLIGQFLGESILVTFLSLLLAIAIAYSLLPMFGKMMGRPIAFDLFGYWWLLPALFVATLLVGVVSGSYPAFVMSSIRAVQVLKVKADVKVSGFSLQRTLIVAQYAVSIALIVGSIVIYRQLDFMERKDLGYDKSDVITIPIRDYSLMDKFQTLTTEWSRYPSIEAATTSTELPTNIASSTIISKKPDGTQKDDLIIYNDRIGYDFLEVFHIKLVAGRNFSKEIAGDVAGGCVINETAARALGWTAGEAVGKQVYRGDRPVTILGVVKDFHMHSMHLAIQPLMLQLSDKWHHYISVKVKPERIAETLSILEKTIKQQSSNPFEYQFLEDNYKQLYESEMKLGQMFGFFTIVSILIASLGLFGLAAFLADQRSKEIGIRKVLGATMQSVVMLLTSDFLKLVGIAFMVAIPVGWYAMHRWLEGFAYRINIAWWMFALAGLLAFVLANIAIGYQSIKASVANPIDSLKSE